MPQLHEGTIGGVIRATIVEDDDALNISGATTMQLIVKPPNRPAQTFTASFTTDGTDGKIEYVTTSADDLPEAGLYKVQAQIVDPTMSPAWNGRTAIGNMPVGPAL